MEIIFLVALSDQKSGFIGLRDCSCQKNNQCFCLDLIEENLGGKFINIFYSSLKLQFES